MSPSLQEAATASEDKKWALDGGGSCFHYEAREGRIFTQYLLLANNKEHSPILKKLQSGWSDKILQPKKIITQSVRSLWAIKCCSISEDSKINS